MRFKKNKRDAATIVDESDKTQKARAKLLKKNKELEKMVTEQALKSKSNQIQQRISFQQNLRVTLKKTSLGLFDENQTSAKPSKKVLSIAEKLKNKSN